MNKSSLTRAVLGLALGVFCAWAQNAPRPQGQNPNGMHVYIWGGLKSHASASTTIRSSSPTGARC